MNKWGSMWTCCSWEARSGVSLPWLLSCKSMLACWSALPWPAWKSSAGSQSPTPRSSTCPSTLSSRRPERGRGRPQRTKEPFPPLWLASTCWESWDPLCSCAALTSGGNLDDENRLRPWKWTFFIHLLDWFDASSTNLRASVATSGDWSLFTDTWNKVEIACWMNSSYSSQSTLSWGVKASRLHRPMTTARRWSRVNLGAKMSQTDFKSTTSARQRVTKLFNAIVAMVEVFMLSLWPSEELSSSDIWDRRSAPCFSALFHNNFQLNVELKIFRPQLLGRTHSFNCSRFGQLELKVSWWLVSHDHLLQIRIRSILDDP